MTTARHAPFRAGGRPGETVALAVPDPGRLLAAGPAVLMADISEFQRSVADTDYLRWSEALAIRAAYGDAHDDRAWYGGQRRDLLHQGGVRFLGIYQYLVAGQDPVAQARAVVRLVGSLRDGEVIIRDVEEGAGNLGGMCAEWDHVIETELGDVPWGYSGLNFASAHGIAPADWVAAYQSTEPSPAHRLWQFTDSWQVPGIGMADCSVFHGTIDELAALAHGSAPPAPPAAPPFPYPAADYLGLTSPDPHCHSGFAAADQPHVLAWQQQMSARGWAIAADGMFGTRSGQVCRAFQAEKGLAADGKVGPVTWAASWTAPVT